MSSLTIVMPVFNEDQVIETLVLDLERQVVEELPEVELVVVDDRSTDRTATILDRLARERTWLVVDHAAANAGHGPSVLRGLRRATGDWIFQLDSDGQFEIEDFWKLWELRNEADLVLGVRVDRHDPAHRIVLSRIISLTVSALAGRRLHDPNVPFRLLRRELWEDLEPLLSPATLAPSILVTLGSVARAWRVVQVPVRHLPRTRGSSSLRSLRLVMFSLRGLGELFAFQHAVKHHPERAALVAQEVP
jgi:glycosyltransferase involved in cell wall biosynthesis